MKNFFKGMIESVFATCGATCMYVVDQSLYGEMLVRNAPELNQMIETQKNQLLRLGGLYVNLGCSDVNQHTGFDVTAMELIHDGTYKCSFYESLKALLCNPEVIITDKRAILAYMQVEHRLALRA